MGRPSRIESFFSRAGAPITRHLVSPSAACTLVAPFWPKVQFVNRGGVFKYLFKEYKYCHDANPNRECGGLHFAGG